MEEKNESQAHEFWQENGEPEQKPIIFRVLCIRVGVGGVGAWLVGDGEDCACLEEGRWWRQDGGDRRAKFAGEERDYWGVNKELLWPTYLILLNV